MENVTITRQEYEKLRASASLDAELLLKLVRGLEDIRNGRVKVREKN